jgi:NTP pyrophosphatase (non-canonical NTP hydrolase)
MSEEIGELSGEVLKSFWRSRKEKLENFSKDNLKWEFADSILTVLLLAEQMWVDINEALEMKLKKIENRGGI